ncbi:adenosylcobinamide-GDP ribazoletransferase [Paenibacillus sp. Marseille-Q4541]|uniref:adenosylcobinamide-GDP ribazoletransferase n=1 Tax=Paenibacillus sp. Marseille-Q4541 TaxID=2831522 RepID=UPI001BA84954|nr:adenosylcobinamide-GDP ribazoletransferase [Paenibacillus sp. Marseille-Q4541]
MRENMKAAAAAFKFLSRFPVKLELDFTPDLMKRSTLFYPVVGLSIGIVVFSVAWVSGFLLPAAPSAVLVLMIWVWLTGGLHLDGWMDSADALLSYRSRERMLEIMKDSRVGAMGVIACVLLLMLKASLLYSLMGEPILMGTAILPFLWSRFFMVYAMVKYDRAREGEGLAGMFAGVQNDLLYRVGGVTLLLSLVCCGISMFAVYVDKGVMFSWGLNMGVTIIAFFIIPFFIWACGKWAADHISHRLGGLTGDVYGALNEGLEAVGLVMLVVLSTVIH